ncbi:hypothetical protein SAMN05421837_111118 [Amycolatopsis pretoriensis]|uniref:Uncharacterized protein n=1 Tax=Amycolatopsis pretoriensis TaxID=218821 RepID=A0A1H5RGL8_9PSEU|nr:hypothetical protein SAMN05421837_111118 [Amycolatopsis pretoriensis]
MQNVFFEGLRETVFVDRDGPDDVTAMSQPPGFLLRSPNLDDIVLTLTSPNATVHIGFSEPGQSEEKVADVFGKLIEKSPSVDIFPEREPNFGVKAVRNISRYRPGKPENGNIPLDARDLTGLLSGEEDTTTGRDDAGGIGDGTNSGKADAESSNGVTGLTGGPQRGK